MTPADDATTPAVGEDPDAPLAPPATGSDALPPPASTVTPAVAMTVLHEILTALAHDAAPKAVFTLIAQKAALLTGSASAVVALLEGAGRDEVRFAAAAGDEVGELTGTRARADDTLVGNTARTGEPFLAYRPDGESVGGGAVSAPVWSAAVVPLYAGGVPVGALAALNKTQRQPFTGDDILTLSTLATAASVALVGAGRRDESQRQSRELSILYDALRNISGHLSTQEVLHALIAQVSAHLSNSAVAIFLLNDERTHLYVAAESGLTTDQRERALPADDSLGTAVLSSTRALFLSFRAPEDEEDDLPGGAEHAAAGRPLESPFPELGARSGLAVALRAGDAVHGLVLVLSSQGSGAYTLADANLLTALSAQAAIAIEGAYLYEDATRRAEEAAALYEISQTVTSTLDLEDVLERVAESVLSLLAVDRFALFLHEAKANRLRLVVSRGLEEGAEQRLSFGAGQGIPGWVLEFETPTAVRDVAADHRNTSAPLHPEGVVSLACMPLQVGSGTIGVLCAMSSRRRLFTVAEMELLYTIANQAAIAIENARIYADVRHKSLELRRYFHRVARALGSSQSPRGVPHLIASLTMEVMAGDRCALYAIRPGGSEPDGTGGPPQMEMVARSGFRAMDEPEGGSARSAAGEPLGIPPVSVTEEFPGGWIAKRGKPIIVEDLTEDVRFAGRFTRPARGRALSYIGVPLKSGRQVVGVLEVYSRAKRRWRAEEVRLLLTFASQATVALENARLAGEREEVSRDMAALTRLLELSRDGALPSPEAVLSALVESLGGRAFLLTRASENEPWKIAAECPKSGDMGTMGPAPEMLQMGVNRSGRAAVGWLSDVDSGARALSPVVLEAAARLINRELPDPGAASFTV